MAWTIPSNAVAATTILASTTNAIIADLVVIGGSWTAYTPTITGLTLGNGTLAGRFKQVDKTVDFTIVFTFGSTSAAAAAPTFTLPATAQTTNWSSGDCNALDASAVAWYPFGAIATSTTVVTLRPLPTTAGNQYGGVGPATPFTWAVSDVLSVGGRYEAA